MSNVRIETKEVFTDVYANADIFVIPNSPVRAESFLFGTYQRMARKVLELNEAPEDDKLVQIWFAESEDLNSNNLSDDGFLIRNGEYMYKCRLGMEYLPLSTLKNLKEGETLEVTLPAYVIFKRNIDRKKYTEVEELDYKFKLHLNCRAAQSEYRYRDFGNFEDVIARM